ncbi:MAG: type VI secretion system contractile sheath large subunit [Candidatus Solibacter sp.]
MQPPWQDPPSQYRISIAAGTGPDGARIELPFTIGVLGDFSGMPATPLSPLRYRRFIHVDLSNLNDVMQGYSPRLAFKVENKLSEDADVPKLNVELRFQGLEDFSPERVAYQIPPLRQLLELRNKLAELRSDLAKDGFGELLQKTMNDREKLGQLATEVTGEANSASAHPQNTERELTAVQPAGQMRPNWTEPGAPPVESRPAAVQTTASARRNWKEAPAPAPEPGVWSTARVAEPPSIPDQGPGAPPVESHSAPVQTTALRNWKETPAPSPSPGVWSTTRDAEPASILDQLVEVRRPHPSVEKERSRDLIKQFVVEVLDGRMTISRDAEAMVNARIAQIDHLVSLQLNEVLHDPEFQRLEATWRGLRFLLHRVRKADHVKVRILNAGKKELLRQFQRERERHSSPLARKVLEEAFGTPGAVPFSLLLGIFEVGPTPEDVEILERLARLCAAAHLPFLAAASPSLLSYDSFSELTAAETLRRTFEAPQFIRWNLFRARLESRYVGLTLPGMMLRLPYGKDTEPVEAFDYEEHVDGTDHSKFLWGSAAWALAARFALDFERYDWCGAPRESGETGEIQNLPRFNFRTDEGDIGSQGAAEIPVSEKLYLDLRALGLIPLCQVAETDSVTFYESWSCHKPTVNPDWDPPTTYESAQIDCMLDVSRIAHCLHATLHRSCQNLASAQQCEERLRKWVSAYVLPCYARGSTFEAAFPLYGADFRIAGAPDSRGKSKLEASLLPKRPGAPLAHPVEITIEIALPWALAQDPLPQPPALLTSPATVPPISCESPNGANSGRDQFIHRTLMAEACLANRKLDVAAMILEDLTEQIDRYHLEEWESPRLITQVWDLLRRCYLLASPSPEAAERSVALLRRICRLDPSRVIE